MMPQPIFLDASKPVGVYPAGGLHPGSNRLSGGATRPFSFSFADLLPIGAVEQADRFYLLPVGGPVIGTKTQSLSAPISRGAARAYAPNASLGSQLGMRVDAEC